MSLFEKMKSLLSSPDLPPETRQAFEKAQSYRDLLAGLDRVCTANEVKLREIEREIQKLEAVERSEVERLREEGVTDRQKKLVLQRISRLRKQILILDDKIDIHTKNIDLHQNLMGKIQRIDSMSMQAVDESLIQEVLTDFEEQFDTYKNVLHTGEAAQEGSTSPLTTKDRAELRKLESELLGPNERREPSQSEADYEVEEETDISETEADASGEAGESEDGERASTPDRQAERDSSSSPPVRRTESTVERELELE